jgi:hypothetical protein
MLRYLPPGCPMMWDFTLTWRVCLMPKIAAGILVGLVLGLYLASTASGDTEQLFSRVEMFFRNILGL